MTKQFAICRRNRKMRGDSMTKLDEYRLPNGAWTPVVNDQHPGAERLPYTVALATKNKLRDDGHDAYMRWIRTWK